MFEDYTKKQRTEIWEDYCKNKLPKWEWFSYKNYMQWDFAKEAPCPKCLKPMIRGQYIFGKQGKAKEAWKIFFLNENNLIEEITNLVPIHVKCY